jgi:hypothetical protein
VVGDAFTFVEIIGHPLRVGQSGTDVDLRPWSA